MTILVKNLNKRAGARRQYTMDYANYGEFQAGEAIVGTPVVTVTPAGLTISSPSVSGATVSFFVSGGSTDTVYEITVTVTTTTGAILPQNGTLTVVA